MSEADILDPGALASLEEMAGGDREFVAELIDTWVSDATDQIAAIERALATGDAESLRRAAHTLKSTSRSLGATQLAAACAEIEARARDGRIDTVGALLPDLHRRHEQAAAALLAARPPA